MFNIDPKNNKGLVELKLLAQKNNMDLKSFLLSDAHLEEVTEIFYKNMPKMIKMAVKKDNFKTIYKTHREMIVSQLKTE